MIQTSDIFRSWVKLFLIFTITVLIGSCSSRSKISNRNLAYLYSPGSNFIHPDFRVVNITPDTSRLFYSIHSDELLYMKSDTGASFDASFSINYQLRSSYESKFVIDSGVVYLEHFKLPDSSYTLTGNFDIKVPAGADYLLTLTVTDHYKNQAVSGFQMIDRTGDQSPNNFLVKDHNTNEPLMFEYIDRPADLDILTTLSDNDSMWMRYYVPDFPLASPPFSSSENKKLSYKSDAKVRVKIGGGNPIQINTPGIYHLQFDTLEPEGLTIMYFNDDYPKITSADDLIEPLRYLTTRQEYDKLRTSKDKKQAIDNYWLDLSGNKERGRVLIKNYYSRVQFANRNFAAYLEGWKSDRGLIYIIFGPPSSVYMSDDSESWNYGQMNSYSSLIFTFDRLNNPFTKNDYRLRRAAYYEVPWYKAVDSWRSGRIVNDVY